MAPAKKTAKKAAPRKATAKATAKTPARAPESDETTAPDPGSALGTVNVPLSASGEHTGRTKALTVRQPSQDQMAWAEGAFYRVTLAMEAANAGETFDQRDRGRVFTELERMTGVFLSAWEADWAKDAMAAGDVQMADLWSAMGDAFEQAGGAPLPVGNREDIVID